MDCLIECVPNFSEGHDKEKIQRIAQAISDAHKEVLLLSVEQDKDYNRVVVTFAGTKEAVLEGAFAGIRQASEDIDMRIHKGEHPRIGATDVVPFIPIRGATMEECAALARELGKRVGSELGIPVYFYAKAAKSPEREVLSKIRQGQYEGLPEKLADQDWKPDAGPAKYSDSIARTGATVIGARPFLIAYNINIASDDVSIAKAIAGLVRTSGRKVTKKEGTTERIPGSLKAAQGMGVALEQHNITQVSMNLLDFSTTGMHAAIEEVRKHAKEAGTEVTGSELVGLVPLQAMLDSGRFYLGKDGEEKKLVEAAIQGLGLDDLAPFDPEQKIIESIVKNKLKDRPEVE